MKLMLTTSDGAKILVERSIASTVLNKVLDEPDAKAIPITAPVLRIVLEWCKHHTGESRQLRERGRSASDKPTQWRWDFLKSQVNDLPGIIEAANYLKLPSLLDLSCKQYAQLIRDKTATVGALSPLPRELVRRILQEYINHFVGHSVSAAYLIQGGTKRDRNKKVNQLSGLSDKLKTFWSANVTGVCLFSNSTKYEMLSMDMGTIQQITEAGACLEQKQFRRLDLGSCIRHDMTPFSVSGQKITIRIRPEAVHQTSDSRLCDEALDSITAALEENTPTTCHIHFEAAGFRGGLHALPSLWEKLETLVISNLDPFPDPIPPPPLLPQPFVHDMVRRLRHLKTIRFEDCVVQDDCLASFSRWLPNVTVELPQLA